MNPACAGASATSFFMDLTRGTTHKKQEEEVDAGGAAAAAPLGCWWAASWWWWWPPQLGGRRQTAAGRERAPPGHPLLLVALQGRAQRLQQRHRCGEFSRQKDMSTLRHLLCSLARAAPHDDPLRRSVRFLLITTSREAWFVRLAVAIELCGAARTSNTRIF